MLRGNFYKFGTTAQASDKVISVFCECDIPGMPHGPVDAELALRGHCCSPVLISAVSLPGDEEI